MATGGSDGFYLIVARIPLLVDRCPYRRHITSGNIRALHIAPHELHKHLTVLFRNQMRSELRIFRTRIWLRYVYPRCPLRRVIYVTDTCRRNSEPDSDTSPVLGILCIFYNTFHWMVADRMNGWVEIRRSIECSCNALKGVAVFLVDVECVYHLGNQNLVLLYFTLLLRGTAAEIVILNAELGTYLHL